MSEEYVVATREFLYAGLIRETGEVFQLIGARNDEGLLRGGHINISPNRAAGVTCCGKTFAGEDGLSLHHHGRIHPRSPNYEGEDARKQVQRPTPAQAVLAAGPTQASVPMA